MASDSQRQYTPLLAFLLLACVACRWIPLLPESFWIDETVTAFVLRHGAGHPSLAAGPRLDQTIYYWLPKTSAAMFGFSEISLRIPSLIATLISLLLIGQLAKRLIHPNAAWFAVFLCFIPHEFTRQATDARPYGFGTLVALSALWFLVRWLDRGIRTDAVLFALSAALLIRVHLIYWPFYAVFAGYIAVRWIRREAAVSSRELLVVLATVIATLIPLVAPTLRLFRDSGSHVVTPMPDLNNIVSGFQIAIIAASGFACWVAARLFGWSRANQRASLSLSPSCALLLLSWWLWQPACLLALSWITGNSMFVPRYFSLALPGAILICCLAAGRSIPATAWKPLALLLACGILVASFVRKPFPPSRNSHWREAATEVNRLIRDSRTPVICPSPFVEAKPPVWNPAYSLPAFLYAHLDAYPIHGHTFLLPAALDAEGEQYARNIIRNTTGRFVVYSGIYGVNLWSSWLADLPELRGWRHRYAGSFGDTGVMLFESPQH